MLVDRKSVPWIVVAVILLIVGAAVYVPYAHMSSKGATGGSWQGITYGIIGTAFMAFAMLLALRKRLRTWRLGRVYTWTQGHVWLALLSYPVILFHAGFHWGPAPSSFNPLSWNLTWIMMWVFTLVVLSGIFGLIVQNIVPSKLLNDVQFETIYDEIDHVIKQLSEEAEIRVENASIVEDTIEAEEASGGGGAAVMSAPVMMMVTARRRLAEFYAAQVKPYLESPSGTGEALSNAARSTAAFEDVRRALPPSMRGELDDIEEIAEERRELDRQRRMHHWLHFWLLVHVPLSYALTVLAIVHIVVALRYR